MDQLLEPELIRLMDDDKQQLIVGVGQPSLQTEQLRNLEIGPIVQPPAGLVLVAHAAKPVRRLTPRSWFFGGRHDASLAGR